MSDTAAPAISATGLTRYFDLRCVVNQLDFDVPAGKVTALLGLNGAGKTTSIRMMMGLLAPTRGRCKTLDVDSQSLSPENRRRIGYLVEGHYLYPWMRVSEIAKFTRSFNDHWDQQRFAEIVAHFAIDARQRAGELSRGQRAGVSLAATLAADPELLIMDDPALGLDPVSRRSLNETLIDFAGQTTRDGHPRTVLLSTHLIDDVERIADEIAVMIAGRLLIHTSLADFQIRVDRYAMEVSPDEDPAALLSKLQAIASGIIEARMVGKHVLICVADAPNDFAEKLKSLAHGDVERLTTSLDDLVVAYLSRERAEHSFVTRTHHGKDCIDNDFLVSTLERSR